MVEATMITGPRYHNMTRTMINGRWPLQLLEHRAARPEWPFWEAHTLALANRLISPGSVVWDIGGEEGDFPALWGSWGAQVVICEPNPRVWPQIRLHWEANCKGTPWCLVGMASDKEVPAKPDYPVGFRGEWPEVAFGEVIPDHGFRNISEYAGVSPQFRLDDLKLPVPDLVMMDIEGGEFHALRGMEQTLREEHPQLIVSVHREFMVDLYNEDADDLLDYMDWCGYGAQMICKDHEEHWWFQ